MKTEVLSAIANTRRAISNRYQLLDTNFHNGDKKAYRGLTLTLLVIMINSVYLSLPLCAIGVIALPLIPAHKFYLAQMRSIAASQA
jgi:hypothetical protein